MLISLLTLLLISNALTLRKDKSILFSRVVMVSLIHTSFLAYNNLFFLALDKGIGIFGGLFHVTVFTQIFNIFIFILSALILTLTSFYPRKVFLNQISSLSFLLFGKFNYNKTKISNKMAGQFRILEYSLIIVFALTGIVVFAGLRQWDVLFLSCFMSNCILLAFMLIDKKEHSYKKSIYQRIRFLFTLKKEEVLIICIQLIFTFIIILCVKKFFFNSLNISSLTYFAYAYVVLFPYIVLVRITISSFIGLVLEKKSISRYSFAKKIVSEAIEYIRFKNFVIFIGLAVLIKYISIMGFIFISYNVHLCDSECDTSKWVDKPVIKLDSFNLVRHENLAEMEYSIKKLNKLISKWDIPNVVLTSAHLQEILPPSSMEITDYYNFFTGTLTSDYRVQNYKDYIRFSSIGLINLEIPLELDNLQLKKLVYQHNMLRVNNYNRLTLARALTLDYNIYKEDYLNRIKHVPIDIQNLNKEFVNYQHELDFLNNALKDYLSKSDKDIPYFEAFKKRQISYHLGMLENLLSDHKFGLSLNRDIKLVGGRFSRDLFTIGQQKSIVAASNIKFLFPNANDFNYLVKDFSSSDQAYQELAENLLYVQLKYMLSFRRLEFLNKSVTLNNFFTDDNLSTSEKENLIFETNQGLERVSKNFIKKNFYFYLQLGHYSQYRILTKTDKGCRVDMFDDMDKKYYIINFLASKGKALQGVTAQPMSSLGINIARDFAFNSPFTNPYGTKDMQVKPSSIYTYWYIGNMISYYKKLD